jgi:hypothetical protein
MSSQPNQFKIEMGRTGARVRGDITITYRWLKLGSLAGLALATLALATMAPSIREAALTLVVAVIDLLLRAVGHDL